MGEYELAAMVIVASGLLCVIIVLAFAAPERLQDVFNVIKVIALALIGKKRSERNQKPPDKPRE